MKRFLGAVVGLAVAGMATVASAATLTYRFDSFIDASAIGRSSNAAFAIEWTFNPDAVGTVFNPPNANPYKQYGVNSGTIWIDNEAYTFSGSSSYDVKNDTPNSLWPDSFQLRADSTTAVGSGPFIGSLNLRLGGGSSILDDLSPPTAEELSLMDLLATDPLGVNDVFIIADWTITDVTPPPPIPLPAAFPLFATALAGLGLLSWRRRKASANAEAA